MTEQGLNELKELATEVEELREKAEKHKERIITIYQEDESIETDEAFSMLVRASVSMKSTTESLSGAGTEVQRAYDAEKELMDAYGLLNDQDNDEADTDND